MKKKKKLIIIIAIITILTITIGFNNFLSRKNATITVNATVSSKTNLEHSISVTGTIKANDSEEITLALSQKISEIFVEEGEHIKKGQTLVKLDTKDIESQLKKSKLSLELSQKELERLEAQEDNTAKQAIENSIIQAELNLETMKLKYEDAQRRHDQNEILYEAGFLSKEELENSKTLLKELEANMKNSEIALDNAQNSLIDFESTIFKQRKQTQISNEDMINLQSKISENEIKSNIDGKVVKMPYKKGQYPAQGQSIKIYDLSRYKIELDINQYDAINLKMEQKSKIKVKGIDKTYTGRVTKIEEVASISTTGSGKETTVKIEITIDDVDELIKVGYEADVEISLIEKQNSIAVPFEAILIDENGHKYIYILQDKITVKRIVQTGLETDFDIEIISGLQEGEIFVTNPSENLKEGTSVQASGGI